MDKTTQDLQSIFKHAVSAVKGKKVVYQELKKGFYPNKFHVIAIGKAADSMLQGIADDRLLSALLITKQGHTSKQSQQNKKISCLEADHPIPKESSLQAGETLLNFLKKLPVQQPCLFLISGGTSALVEVLNDDWDLSLLAELNQYLLSNAYSIDQINAVRRDISQIKGGGLWQFIQNRAVYCFMISDVKGDHTVDIGSGLLFAKEDNELPALPEKWLSKINKNKANNDADVVPAINSNFKWKIVASLKSAKQAAAKRAEELGYKVVIMPNFLQGEASSVAINCVQSIRKKPNTLFIWGGETTVQLPANAGLGGRNQHLALAAAIEMQGLERAVLLAAGTDGSDGMTDATGAMVTNKTVSIGRQQNQKAKEYLHNADSNNYFKKTGGLIVTGATGTNVMDLVLAILHFPLDLGIDADTKE